MSADEWGRIQLILCQIEIVERPFLPSGNPTPSAWRSDRFVCWEWILNMYFLYWKILFENVHCLMVWYINVVGLVLGTCDGILADLISKEIGIKENLPVDMFETMSIRDIRLGQIYVTLLYYSVVNLHYLF